MLIKNKYYNMDTEIGGGVYIMCTNEIEQFKESKHLWIFIDENVPF